MTRDYCKEVAQAIEAIYCTHDAQGLSLDTLAERVMKQIDTDRISGSEGLAGVFNTDEVKKVNRPELCEWAAKRFFKLLLGDLLRHDHPSFVVHLNCGNKKGQSLD